MLLSILPPDPHQNVGNCCELNEVIMSVEDKGCGIPLNCVSVYLKVLRARREPGKSAGTGMGWLLRRELLRPMEAGFLLKMRLPEWRLRFRWQQLSNRRSDDFMTDKQRILDR